MAVRFVSYDGQASTRAHRLTSISQPASKFIMTVFCLFNPRIVVVAVVPC